MSNSNLASISSQQYINKTNQSGQSRIQYDDLQKKIEMLKQENKGLRKHLY